MALYRARWLVPVDGPPIEDGVLGVHAGRITTVGPAADDASAKIRDLGDCILLPGFVNAHTHLELTCYRDRLAPADLWSWLDRLAALRLQPGMLEREPDAVRAGAMESLAAGVTCVGDISRLGVQVDALRTVPIRKVCFIELISGVSLPPNDGQTLRAAVNRALGLAEPDRLVVGVTPHAPYTVTMADLAAAAALAAERALPMTVHFLETAEEADWLRGRGEVLNRFLAKWALPTVHEAAAGLGLVRLRRAGILAQRPLLAHVNYVADDEIAELAASGASVVWCPRTHQFFGHAPHRWREMLNAGINVCVGTDSLASSPGLSILDELRFVRQQHPGVAGEMLLELATFRGARALGLAHCIGSLSTGKRADFIAVPWADAGPSDPVANLLDGHEVPRRVWVDGELVHGASDARPC